MKDIIIGKTKKWVGGECAKLFIAAQSNNVKFYHEKLQRAITEGYNDKLTFTVQDRTVNMKIYHKCLIKYAYWVPFITLGNS